MTFVQNNWRPAKIKTHARGYTVSVNEIVWQMHRDTVVKEIAERCDITVDKVQFSDPQCFGARLGACKEVLDNCLTGAEQSAVRAEVRRRKRYGNPPDVQARYDDLVRFRTLGQ